MSGDFPHYDVAVVGGGPAGIGAAVAAGRAGRSVVLVERHDIIGGMGTSALVNNFCPAHLDGFRLIIGGVFGEVRQRLIARRAIYASMDFRYKMEPYDPKVFIEVCEDLCREAGVRILTGAVLKGVEFRNGGAARLDLGGVGPVRAAVVVDTTGDGLVAAQAGVPFTFGRDSDHAVMPLTYCYKIGPIDLAQLERELPGSVSADPLTGERYCSLSTHPKINRWIMEARAKGELSIPRDHVAAILSIPGQPEYATVNFGRVVCKDPTNPAALAAAEAEGRRQIEDGVRFFRNHLPGFAGIKVVEIARQIGVRESRQIRGLYTLTGGDASGCRQFEDVVAQCCYAIDIHDPDSDGTILREFARGTHFDIPWRCLVPLEGPSNLVIGGRCISATQEAMSSFRVSPSVMAIGEAAGATAALAAANGCPVHAVDPGAVQHDLLRHGAVLA